MVFRSAPGQRAAVLSDSMLAVAGDRSGHDGWFPSVSVRCGGTAVCCRRVTGPLRRAAPGSRLRARLRLFRLHRPPGWRTPRLDARRSGVRVPGAGQGHTRPAASRTSARPGAAEVTPRTRAIFRECPGTDLGANVAPVQIVAQDRRACALAAAEVAGQRDRDERNGRHQPQQHHCLLQAQALVRSAGLSRFGARTPDRSPRADMDLLARRHLLAGCQPGEYGQPRDQGRLIAGKLVLNRVQGLLLPRAQAHHWSPHRFAVA